MSRYHASDGRDYSNAQVRVSSAPWPKADVIALDTDTGELVHRCMVPECPNNASGLEQAHTDANGDLCVRVRIMEALDMTGVVGALHAPGNAVADWVRGQGPRPFNR